MAKNRSCDVKNSINLYGSHILPSITGQIAASRRRILCNGAIILGAALSGALLASHAATAGSAKTSQAGAGYRNSPNGDARCDKCMQFQPPSGCKIVDGVISPSGSCSFFASRT